MHIKNSSLVITLKNPSLMLFKLKRFYNKTFHLTWKILLIVFTVVIGVLLAKDSLYVSYNKLLDNIGILLLVIGVATVIEKKNFGLITGISGALILFLSATAFSTFNHANVAAEERLEDFDYFYELMMENYPLLQVHEEIYGINWAEEKEIFKSNIENNITDKMSDEEANQAFTLEVNRSLGRLYNNLNYVVGRTFLAGHSVYRSPEYKDNFELWDQVLDNEKVLDWYNFEYIEDHHLVNPYRRLQNRDFTPSGSYVSDIPACRTAIIIPGEVAYLGIYSMNIRRLEADGKIIRDFFETVKDYDKLIIDVRGNWGGDDRYWRENVVAPLIGEQLSVNNYFLIRGSYTKAFYESREIDLFPVSELDQDILDKIPGDAKNSLDYYGIHNVTIDPIEPVGFEGDIYLIVDNGVYASTDRFASFSKDSGFATLVGQMTAGNAVAFEPIIFPLPNSGMIVSYRGELLLNGDGNITTYTGTIPHIHIPNISIKVPAYRVDVAVNHIINIE